MIDFIPEGAANRPGYPNGLKYITIHETGNTDKGANAKAHAAYLKGPDAARAQVSWHYTVDDKEYWQHLPDNESAYHAGDGGHGTGNSQSIGIEICVNSDGDFNKAKQNAAALTAGLMLKYSIALGNVVQHNKWNGKDCPYNMRHTSGGWDGFVKLVDTEYKKLTPPPAPSDAEIMADRAVACGLIENRDYWVDVLNGKVYAKPEYLMTVFDRACDQIEAMG